MEPAPGNQFLQLFRVLTLAWPRKKLARHITLPSAAPYGIEKKYTVLEKSKSSMPKRVLKATRNGYSWG